MTRLIVTVFVLVTLLVIGETQACYSSSFVIIDGVIIDTITREPIPMVKINIGGGGRWFEQSFGSTTTDPYGRYSIQVPQSAQYHVLVIPREIEQGQYRFYDHCWVRRTIAYVPHIRLDFDLEPAGSILVKMFDPDGKALGYNSMESSWVKKTELVSLSGEVMDNRTSAHTRQAYRSDDEELILLSPTGLSTVVSIEMTTPQYGRLKATSDNEGRGYAMRRGELLVMNLNYEVAKAVCSDTNSTIATLFGRPTVTEDPLIEVASYLTQAQHAHSRGDDAECASKSNAALLEILRLRIDMFGLLKIPFTKGHPRLLFSHSELETLKKKLLGSSGFQNDLWNFAISRCRGYLTGPLPQLPEPEYDAWSREAAHDVSVMEYLAFAYVITGDTQYATRANATMYAILSWTSWEDPTEGNIPDLMTGTTTAGIAITYDWLFNYLSPEDRVQVVRIVSEKGAEPLYQGSISGAAWWHDSSHSNWNAITHAGLGIAGLAFLGEHPNASKWITLAAAKIQKFYDSGGKNGGWGEGLGYWTYALSRALPFTDALRRVTGADLYKSPFLRETSYFPIYLITPIGHVNFEDSGPLDVTWVAALTLRLSSEYNSGYGQSFFNMLRERYGTKEMTWDAGIFSLIWYDDSVKPKPLNELPLSRLFEGLGWIVARSGWGSDDSLLAFKSGPNWNHGHADQNNFIFEAFGEPLLVDLGYGPQTKEYFKFGTPVDYYHASVGHNVILFDKKGQLDPRSGWAQPPNGKISVFQTWNGLESYEYMVGDASGAYSMVVKFIRQVIFVQHRFLVILDSVEAPTPSRFQWLIHTTASDIKTEGGEFRIRKGNAVLSLKFLLPDYLDVQSYHDQRRAIEWSKEEAVTRSEASTQEPASTATFLTVLYPTKAGESAPEISLIQNATTWSVKILDNSTHYLFFDRTTLPPAFLVAKSQSTSLIGTAADLLKKAKAESSVDHQTAALIESAEAKYQEAVKFSDSGDYQKASSRATESIAESAKAINIATSRKYESQRNSMIIMIVAIALITSASVTLAVHKLRRRRRSGKQ